MKRMLLFKRLLWILSLVFLFLRFAISFVNQTADLYLFLFGKPQLLFELILYALIILCVSGLIVLYSEVKKNKIITAAVCGTCMLILSGIFISDNLINKTFYDESPYSSRQLIAVEGKKQTSFYVYDRGFFVKDTNKRLSAETASRPFSSPDCSVYWLNDNNILLTYGPQRNSVEIQLVK